MCSFFNAANINRMCGVIDGKTVVSVILIMLNHTETCNMEMPIGDIPEGTTTWTLRYSKTVLMPEKILISIVTHVSKICYFDR